MKSKQPNKNLLHITHLVHTGTTKYHLHLNVGLSEPLNVNAEKTPTVAFKTVLFSLITTSE